MFLRGSRHSSAVSGTYSLPMNHQTPMGSTWKKPGAPLLNHCALPSSAILPERRREEKQEKVLTPGYRARRWVVERTHSWINRSRRLLVRWEKKGENYLAFLHLACAQLIFAKILVFG